MTALHLISMMIAMKKIIIKASRGRSLSFDRQAALQTALHLFWKHGYEGTSIAELVVAIGIAPPSLYSTFGSKEQLYQEVIALYLQGPGNFIQTALGDTDSGCGFIERILLSAAREFSAHSHPPGCIVATGLVASSALHHQVAQSLAELRNATLQAIEQRLQQAKDAGELPPTSDCRALARLFAACIQGMSIQARDGASAEE
ncbi:MAG: AcrR family transcriptional regulator [Pseudomonas sp.]